MTPTCVLVPRFVDAQTVLPSQAVAEFFIGPADRGGDFLHDLRQLPATEVQPGQVAPEAVDRRVRHVASGLLERNRCREPRTDQACRGNLRRQRRDDDPAGARITIPTGSILGDHKRLLHQFHLLNDVPSRERPQPSCLFPRQLALNNPVHVVRSERFSFVLGVSRLTADRPLLSSLGRIRLGRFHYIAGRWLGTVPRVLPQTRDFCLQLGDSCLQRRNRLGDRRGDQLANFVFSKEASHPSFITHAPQRRNTNSSKSVNGYNGSKSSEGRAALFGAPTRSTV